MDSSSGASSNSSGPQNSGSEGDLRQVMDQRKRKRMISNRESARRSRLRKQKHLDELMAQVAELRKENQQILAGLSSTTQHYVGVESENAILRAQAAELSHRLQSLDEIVAFLSAGCGALAARHEEPGYGAAAEMAGFGNGYWNCASQPMMMAASASASAADPGFLMY